ncbi:YjjI family glycine radical enzyme [Breznakia sp. PF5-3]|uniref:YjjI family glycine radical enzyme n=1 Tax=unclassified Breznakia TaxID=2623764 RepID=UPI0024070D1C|nr:MULTISPECIES: YjjI family glycine radical enzyme [unclassified Breznakia]MDF9825664.1 YjjI family glycine radical enzyme [Breznakia sp. PM6-1]MDF9836496.1 YjjI family glycine radical enzyme [Breznakia sp. PF5-3]MDF9838641.1 YjjI family glycine radical enzyme [Breznakia sp. PFB2-8]MDF9860672.1 YjjI family glycine radical enzyme [Breznakia sp. PH5-24]
MSKVSEIIKDPTLTYQQQVLSLARLAESEDDSLPRDKAFIEALQDGVLCDLGEGLAPYRPRYIVPDYELLMKKGCEFLDIAPPSDIWEATNALLIFYKHVPSITSFPVYLGNFSTLFAPFDTEEEITRKALKLFLQHIDKTLTDSFVHSNIGPKENRVGHIILDLTKEMQLAIPNLTLLYNPEKTSNEFALKCVDCMLETSKPSFANDAMYAKNMDGNYAIVSCYNALKIAGGGYTLPRIRLYDASLKAKDADDFLNNILPYYVEVLLKNMDQRITYIVEESSFFKSNFLAKEGFVKQENFTGMFGVVGLAECTNNLLGISDKSKGYGHDKDAEKLASTILDKIHDMVEAHHGVYCEGCNNTYVMHAQVGIDTDGTENSPGCRIPIGSEPELRDHLLLEAKMHKHFISGIGDIFKFDKTWNKNPQAILDIIKGAFTSGMRYFTGYNADNDVVRVTGYLVKRSEIEKLRNNEASLNQVTLYGKGAEEKGKALSRRVYENSNR